jgi:hypothetical protein
MLVAIEKINDWLKEFGGENPQAEPFFRIVWSNDQYEIRNGEFNIFSGMLFLRTEIGDKLVRKYNYIHERWILEKWFPQSLVRNTETPAVTNGDYEPFYVFQDKNGNYLFPTLKVVEFIFYSMMHGKPSTEQEILTEMKIKEDKEIQTFMDMIDTSPIGNALRMKEAVGYTKGIKDAN